MKPLSKKKLLKVLNNDADKFYGLIVQEWCSANWELLSQFKSSDIKKHLKSADLHLILASVYQNIDNFKKAEKYFRKSMKLGSSLENVADVCFADIYNTRAKLAAIKQDNENMKVNFKKSMNISFVANHQKSLSQIRGVKELSTLGLFSQVLENVKKEFKILEENKTDEDINSKLHILKTEIELLSHELSLSQQRMQLYKNKDNSINMKTDLNSLKNRSVSQLGQDIWVLEQTNFKQGGFFVEFGATDGVLLSNTFLLEKEFEWKGICAEPNPKFYKKLKKNRNCSVSNACIGAMTGEKVNFVFAQEYGGMQKHMADDMHKDKREAYLALGENKELETISLDDFLLKHNAPKQIDYLSIDTEGSEYEILQNFPFEQWDIRMITVEHNDTKNRDYIFQLLIKHGYSRQKAKWDDWYIKTRDKNDIS